MPTGFFSRIMPNMSFSQLQAKAIYQQKSGIKPIEYNIVDEVCLETVDFKKLLIDISMPISQYSANYSLSITSPNGIWNCIEFKCPQDIRSVIVYTSGRSLPLYAAPYQENTMFPLPEMVDNTLSNP